MLDCGFATPNSVIRQRRLVLFHYCRPTDGGRLTKNRTRSLLRKNRSVFGFRPANYFTRAVRWSVESKKETVPVNYRGRRRFTTIESHPCPPRIGSPILVRVKSTAIAHLPPRTNVSRKRTKKTKIAAYVPLLDGF